LDWNPYIDFLFFLRVFCPISCWKNSGEKLKKKTHVQKVSGGGNKKNGKEIGEENSRTEIERRRKQENEKEIGEGHVDGNIGNNSDSRRKNGHGFSWLMIEAESF
jgi:hypothetical protein